jgi:predicted small lipoprotein YifL
MCWANKIFFLMIFLLAITSFLGGCGNKGKLQLPDQNNQTTTTPIQKNK